jgi:N4-gp56 family major capsid protein
MMEINMARTLIGINDPKATKKWAGETFVSTVPNTFWGKNLMASNDKDANAPVHIRNDLQQGAGDEVSYNIYAQLTGQPVFGDDTLEGNEASLEGFADKVTINSIKKPVDVGGQMTRKRVMDDLRAVAKRQGQDYMTRFFDEAHFATIAGSRGVNPDYILPVGVSTYVAGTQPFTAYNQDHILYGGAATNKASMVASDKMTLDVLDRVITMAETEGGGQDGKMRISPLSMDGENKFVMVMHTWQEHDMRVAAGTNRWAEIQKAAAASVGYSSNIFKNSAGEYRGCVLRKASKVVRFNDYGAGSNVGAARAVLMGRQALVTAFGDAGDGQRASWKEKATDLDDSKIKITFGMCFGIKRPQFNGNDISSIVVDTAVVKPY